MAIVFQNRVMRYCDTIHALTDHEREHLWGYGLRNEIVVVPNGVDEVLLTIELDIAKARFYRQYPYLNCRFLTLFLSRIHPKKGLLTLLHAWKQLSEHTVNWHLVIAGPDEAGHTEVVRMEIERLGLKNQVSLIGPQHGAMVWSCYAAAEIFALPSYSEGFSMAVLEALALKLPVCISSECNFPEVETYNCGSICEPTVDSLSHKLLHLIEMDSGQRRQMGKRGHKLVEERYTWPQVAKTHLEIYDRLHSAM